MRIEPPWSPPVAMSTNPPDTSAALPPEEPPACRVASHGFSTCPVEAVMPAPEKQRSSQTALPVMVAIKDNRGFEAVLEGDVVTGAWRRTEDGAWIHDFDLTYTRSG